MAPRVQLVVDEEAWFLWRNGLRSRLIHRFAADARKLKEQQQRPGDLRARGANTGIVSRTVGAFHERGSNVYVVHESLHAVEDESPVRESDKRLCGAGSIQLESEFNIVRAFYDGNVIVHL